LATSGRTIFGSRKVAPIPGCRPRAVKFSARRASSETMRMSAAQAKEKAAPMASPLMAAMVG
jgi:hypothetical protein